MTLALLEGATSHPPSVDDEAPQERATTTRLRSPVRPHQIAAMGARAGRVLGFTATRTLPEMLKEVAPWTENAVA